MVARKNLENENLESYKSGRYKFKLTNLDDKYLEFNKIS